VDDNNTGWMREATSRVALAAVLLVEAGSERGDEESDVGVLDQRRADGDTGGLSLWSLLKSANWSHTHTHTHTTTSAIRTRRGAEEVRGRAIMNVPALWLRTAAGRTFPLLALRSWAPQPQGWAANEFSRRRDAITTCTRK
jgi:hypothetical protein